MKRFVPLSVALILFIPVAGCDSAGGGSPPAKDATPAAPATATPGTAKKGERPIPNPANPNGPKRDR